jgi:hypothetical protein
VTFHEPYDDVSPALLAPVALVQHGKGLAHPGGGAKVEPEMPGRFDSSALSAGKTAGSANWFKVALGIGHVRSASPMLDNENRWVQSQSSEVLEPSLDYRSAGKLLDAVLSHPGATEWTLNYVDSASSSSNSLSSSSSAISRRYRRRISVRSFASGTDSSALWRIISAWREDAFRWSGEVDAGSDGG